MVEKGLSFEDYSPFTNIMAVLHSSFQIEICTFLPFRGSSPIIALYKRSISVEMRQNTNL